LVTVLALADWADDDGWCWPSLTKLAQKARVTVSHVCKILSAIEQGTGEVHRERSTGGKNHRTRYRVTVTENSVTDNSVVGNSVAGNSVTQAYQTVSPVTHAIIRHRTVNKREATESDNPIPDSPSTKEKRKQSRAVPAEIRPAIARIVARINELSGSQFRDDKPGVLKHLIARLDDGDTEADCIAVVEYQWLKWGGTEMADNFNTVTLFRDSNFPRYLENAKRANGNGHAKPIQVKDLGNGMVEVDGVQMDRRIYERRHGQHAN
jgi:uncharacterized phage protein (TIGR02220 family)